MQIRILGVLLLVVSLTGGLRMAHADKGTDSRAAIGAVLDAFHASASKADATRYFALLTEDAVFLGTDATERWPKQAFESFARPYFEKGKGWTYVSTQRNVVLDPNGTHATFDELLHNESYGTCRGSGMLRVVGGTWRIAQYNLSIPVPNALAREFVARIRAADAQAHAVRTVLVMRHLETAGEAEDRPLSDVGRARAERLATLLAEAGITRCITSRYKRTQETLAPLAAAQGLKLEPDERSMADLASALRTGTDATVLVAGHSNTAPELLRELGVKDEVKIPEDRFGDLFLVRIPTGGTPSLLRLRVP